MRFVTYPSQKISRFTSLGEVPSHWDAAILRRLTDDHKQGYYTSSGYVDHGVKLLRITDIKVSGAIDYSDCPKVSSLDSSIKHFLLKDGDFVFARTGGAGSFGLVQELDEDVVFASYLIRFRFSAGRAATGFLKYYLLSSPFLWAIGQNVHGGVNQNIHAEDIKNAAIALPGFDEQTKIAKFLDYETAKIDALIEKQQQLIALLKEKRQAVISHSVTKGLSPDAPMRDSGVEWLGEVPAHWRVGQLRRWIREMEQGKSPECESRPAEGNEWGVLKTGCVNGGVFAQQENKALPAHITPVEKYEVHAGDVLMSRASGSTELIGSVAFVKSARPKILLSDKIFRLHFERNVDGRYFTSLMASSYMRSSIVSVISGAEGMANNITKPAVLGFPAAIPPIGEQQAIAAHIDDVCDHISELTTSASRLLELLNERRTALISAAVTGKIDVRGWKPPESKPQTEAA